MNKNIKKQRMIIVSVSALWLVVMAIAYTQLPDIVPLQFNLKGEVAREISKSIFYMIATGFYALYLVYCWIRFKNILIPRKQLITIYFLMGFSLFMLFFGQFVSK